MIHRNLRLTKGVFDLVGRGDGIVCPRCRNFAPAQPGGDYRCQRCGAVLRHEKVGVESAPIQGKPVRAKTTIPSGTLGGRAAPAAPAPVSPTVPAPAHEDIPPALDDEP